MHTRTEAMYMSIVDIPLSECIGAVCNYKCRAGVCMPIM